MMRPRQIARLPILLLLVFVQPIEVRAQDLDADQIVTRLQHQRDMFKTGGADAPLGGARGLVPWSAKPASPQSAGGTEASSVVPSSQYSELPQQDQVNIRITFAFDSSAIAQDQMPRLRQLCGIVRKLDIKHFRIIGHTDAVGTPAYNKALSDLRAREVMRFFTDDCAIEPERLEAVGVGQQYPYDANRPRDAKNRRVEFQALG